MKHRNIDWEVPEPLTWESVKIAVLLDIREELRKLNRVMQCPNVLRIPRILDEIQSNTRKPKRKKPRKP